MDTFDYIIILTIVVVIVLTIEVVKLWRTLDESCKRVLELEEELSQAGLIKPYDEKGKYSEVSKKQDKD